MKTTAERVKHMMETLKIKEQTEFVENDVNVLNRIRSEIKTDSLQKLLDEWLRVGKDVIQESNKKRKTTNTYMISSRCS